MSSQALVSLTHLVQRIGARILEALCRLGFEHRDRDGRMFRPTFSEIVLYGDLWAVYEIDAGRLWHFSITDLGSVKVVEQLSAVLRKPVRALKRNGLYYVVELKPAPPAQRLPNRVSLDLSSRPGDPMAVPVGVSISGPVWQSLPNLGHCLILGASGSGKSTWLHCALAALLTANTPGQLQVVLIDPKRIELAIWADAPHLRGPVACDVDSATAALADLVQEMDRRGDLLAGLGARDLASYNRRVGERGDVSPLPYILAMIDECLDLTLQAGNKSELVNLLKRLASKARATGVIVCLAATHGTADVLPRVVTVNLSSRVVFRVQDGNAARLAGCPGAESLPRDKPGRLLARLESKPVELQGFFVSDEQLQMIAGSLAGGQVSPACVGRSPGQANLPLRVRAKRVGEQKSR